MALEAKRDFPEIEFKKSIMIGDSLSDLQFAHNAGMYAVYLSPNPQQYYPYDFAFNDLYEFAKCFI
jgi:histidinol phosphatase-like enzyme